MQIIRQNEAMKVNSLFVVIFGDEGVGKTSAAFTASPNTVLLDFDMGAHRAKKRKNVARFNDWGEVLTAFNMPHNTNGHYDHTKQSPFSKSFPNCDTIILDTGAAMLDGYIAKHVKQINPKSNMNPDGTISLRGYGAMAQHFSAFINPIIRMGINVIMICHATDSSKEEGSKKIPEMTGKSFSIIRQKADLMGFMFRQGKSDTILDFNPSNRHIGKNAPQFDAFDIPDYRTPQFNTFMQDILNDAIEHMASLSEEELRVNELVDELKEAIWATTSLEALQSVQDSYSDQPAYVKAQLQKEYNEQQVKIYEADYVEPCETAEQLNNLMVTLASLGKSLKLSIFNKMKDRAKSIKAIYNEKTKKFEQEAVPVEQQPRTLEHKEEKETVKAKPQQPKEDTTGEDGEKNWPPYNGELSEQHQQTYDNLMALIHNEGTTKVAMDTEMHSFMQEAEEFPIKAQEVIMDAYDNRFFPKVTKKSKGKQKQIETA